MPTIIQIKDEKKEEDRRNEKTGRLTNEENL